MNTLIKVLVVDDSLFMRKAMSEILAADPHLEVVGTARDGADALSKIEMHQPDVVILDIDMPGMNGMSAIRHIMIRYPVPIVVFSSLFTYGDVTFESLELGVVDFLPKPSGMVPGNMHQARKKIIDRVKIASCVDVDTLRRVKVAPKPLNTPPRQSVEHFSKPLMDNVISVGAGFSGTNSVIRLVSQLSPCLSAAIIASIGISPKILPSFAKKFSARVPWEVVAVEDGQELKPGVCYIGSNENTVRAVLDKNNTARIRVSGKSANPLNALFTSSTNIFNLNTIGVMLAGLGEDGADGFSHIQAYNGVTIAVDKNYCVQPNITQNAIAKGAVSHIVDEDRLHKTIESSLAVRVEYKVA